MKINTLFVINAIVAAIFGIVFVVIPGQVIPLYGIVADAPVKSLGQLYGAALLAFAVLTWAARNAPDSEARRAIIVSLLVGDTVGTLAALYAQLSGVYNQFGWSTVVIYLFLSLGYAYFYFIKPSSA